MKKLFFLFAVLVSTISYGQLNPKEFTIRTINDADSALVILTKAAKVQIEMPVDIEITKDFIAQTWQIGEMNARTIVFLTYYNEITKVNVKKDCKIFITNSKNVVDHLFFKDKIIAEQTFAALMCLIKNSGNKNYDEIMTNALKK